MKPKKRQKHKITAELDSGVDPRSDGRSMPSPTQKKSQSIGVDIKSAVLGDIVFVNHALVREDDGYFYLYFGFQAPGQIGAAEDVGVCLPKEDFELQRANLEQYFAQIADSVDDLKMQEWAPTRLRRIHSANILQVTRRSQLADITVIAFSLHDTVAPPKPADATAEVKKKGVDKEVASRIVVTLRSPLKLHLAVLEKLLRKP